MLRMMSKFWFEISYKIPVNLIQKSNMVVMTSTNLVRQIKGSYSLGQGCLRVSENMCV